MAQSIKPWFVYMVRCSDNTLYTGVTTDVERRVAEHNGVGDKGAKYTKVRRPVTLVYQSSCADRSVAGKAEAGLRQLSKAEKERLLLHHSDESVYFFQTQKEK